LYPSQPVTQPVEYVAEGLFAGQIFIFPPFFCDQRGAQGLGRQARVLERCLELGIGLTFRLGQSADIGF